MIGKILDESTLAKPSALGWVAARFAGTTLLQTVIGSPSRGAALRAGGSSPHVSDRDAGTLLDSEDRSFQDDVVERIVRFAEGEVVSFHDVHVDLSKRTDFQRRIFDRCRRIGWGETATYGSLAESAGRPGAARAVGSTMAKNPTPIIIPCHRVVGVSGLGGYSAPGGTRTKQRLLDLERA